MSRPVNEQLRQAKLAVALSQLSTIEQRYSQALHTLKELESKYNSKVNQVQALGGQVASGLEETATYELPNTTSNSTIS